MVVDKWGIPFFYVSKTTAGISGSGNGFYWTQSNNIHDDDDYEGDAMLRIGKEHDLSTFKVVNTTTGEWQFPFTFDSGDGLSLSGPTGHHTGGVTHGCQGFTYMINVTLDETPPHFRFRKETFHVQYNNHPEGLWTHPDAPDKIVGGGWFGYGWVRYNKKDGRAPGKDSVICEVWWNNDPVADITNWKMLKRVEDKGSGVTNWGVSATCDGEAYQVGTWSNIQFRFKIDSSDFSLHPLIPEPDDGPNIMSIGGESMSFSDSEARGYGKRADMPRDIEMKCLFKMDDTSGVTHFKNVSLREIDPELSPDDNPQEPPPPEQPPGTTTLQGNFKFQQDINEFRTSACAGVGTGGGGGGGGGGTPTGNAIFYTLPADHDKELSNSSTFDNRTGIGEKIKTSSSSLKGKKVIQADVPLKKVGTPTTPDIHVKIWNSSGSVIYTCPTNINPSTLTTSFQYFTFDMSTNTHLMVVGDIIGVEWTGTSSTDYVVAGYEDGPTELSVYVNLENGSFEEKGSRDWAADLWE